MDNTGIQNVRVPLLQFLLALVVCAGVAYLLGSFVASSNTRCSERYAWLNPALDCEAKPVISKAVYLTFEKKMQAYIDAAAVAGKVETVGLYFRDLENGPTFNINSNEPFIPASLLKTPIMLTYFKLAEEQPELLNHPLTGVGFKDEITQDVAPEETIAEGGTYTVEELVWRMVVYSDNRASDLLLSYLDKLSPSQSLVTETFVALGLANPGDDIAQETLTVKTYASLFRVLYNASFLTNDLSDKALQYLSQVEFAKGLRSGVPAEVPIAHKFGERALPSGVRQLHDCGIVYYPGNPYLLCVMTRGDNFDELSEVLSTISRMVYEEVDSRRF